MSSPYAFFATCPKGLETLLLQELRSLGSERAKETVAGVHFDGPLELAYRACLWSRLANKILMPVATVDCKSVEDLYRGVNGIGWDKHLSIDNRFRS